MYANLLDYMNEEEAINKILEIYESTQVNKNRYIIKGKNKNVEETISNVRKLQK